MQRDQSVPYPISGPEHSDHGLYVGVVKKKRQFLGLMNKANDQTDPKNHSQIFKAWYGLHTTC